VFGGKELQVVECESVTGEIHRRKFCNEGRGMDSPGKSQTRKLVNRGRQFEQKARYATRQAKGTNIVRTRGHEGGGYQGLLPDSKRSAQTGAWDCCKRTAQARGKGREGDCVLRNPRTFGGRVMGRMNEVSLKESEQGGALSPIWPGFCTHSTEETQLRAGGYWEIRGDFLVDCWPKRDLARDGPELPER